jgi:hypothetical protein
MADEADIGEELEVKVKPALLPLLSGIELKGARWVEVTNLVFSPAAPAAARRDAGLTVLENLEQKLRGITVVNNGAEGHAYYDVPAFPAGLVLSRSGFSVLSFVVALVSEIVEACEVFLPCYDNVSSLPAITAVGSASRNELLSSETYTATPTFSDSTYMIASSMNFIKQVRHAPFFCHLPCRTSRSRLSGQRGCRPCRCRHSVRDGSSFRAV